MIWLGCERAERYAVNTRPAPHPHLSVGSHRTRCDVGVGGSGGGGGFGGKEIVGQEYGSGVIDGDFGDLEQVIPGFDAAELGCVDQAVEQGGDPGPAFGPRSVVILSPDDNAAQGALRCVVVERDDGIVEEQGQPRSQAEHVVDRLAQATLRAGPLLDGPVTNLLDDLA